MPGERVKKIQQDSSAHRVLYNRNHNPMNWNMKTDTKMLSAAILLAGTFYGFGQGAFGATVKPSKSLEAEAARPASETSGQAGLKAMKLKAEHGDARAQYLLGRMYDNGSGARENPARAAKWYRKAAEQDFAPAQYGLGRLYAAGEGVGLDYAEAMKWLRKAAAQDYALAKNRLGVMYEKGQGVAKNDINAYSWYTLAAEGNRNVFGVANREALERRMTSAQILKAQNRAGVLLAASAFKLADGMDRRP